MARPTKRMLAWALLGLSLLAPALAGCRSSGQPPQGGTGANNPAPGAQAPVVTAWCDPWPPVQLSEDTAGRVLALLEQSCSGTVLPNLQGVLVFHLRVGAGSQAVEATLYRGGVVAEGLVRSDPGAGELWQAVRAEVCTGARLARLVSAAGEVCVVCRDVGGLEVPLDGKERQRVVVQAAALGPYSEEEEAPSPMPYPDYGLEVGAGGSRVALFLHPDRVVTVWGAETASRGQMSFGQEDQALWHLLGELVPAPDPASLEGPARLFVYQCVRAEGGPLAEPMEAPPGWTVLMVRCLLGGKPGAGGVGPPAGEEPVPVVFSDPSGKLPPCTVLLHENGFILDGRFYQATGIQRVFLTTLNNAGSA